MAALVAPRAATVEKVDDDRAVNAVHHEIRRADNLDDPEEEVADGLLWMRYKTEARAALAAIDAAGFACTPKRKE